LLVRHRLGNPISRRRYARAPDPANSRVPTTGTGVQPGQLVDLAEAGLAETAFALIRSFVLKYQLSQTFECGLINDLAVPQIPLPIPCCGPKFRCRAGRRHYYNYLI
jgi:hypothetical protein